MTKKINILSLSLMAMVLLAGCSKELEPVYSGTADPATLNALSAAEVVLEKANAAQTFQTFTWTPADYGLFLATTYSVEMALAGTSFETPSILGTTTGDSFSITVKDMNNALKRMGCPENEPSQIEFRVKSDVNPAIPVVYSAIQQMAITPYSDITVYPALNIPGSYQGWDPTNMTTVIYSVGGDEKYDGYIYVGALDPNSNEAEFKFAKGSWDVNWGDDGTKTGKLKSGGDNLKVAAVGMYHISINLNELTYSVELTSWAVIGAVTGGAGWDTDWVLTYDPDLNALKYYGHFAAGEFKFRANNDWPLNLGAHALTDPEGALSYGGSNLVCPKDGDFTLVLRLNQAIYTYKFYPGTVVADWPYLNIPGAHQGWDPTKMSTVIWSAKADEFYEGYMWFPTADNEFKFAYNSWATNWGDDGSGSKLKPDGDNLKAGAAGLYRLRADMSDLSYSFVLTNWGIVGDATPGGWDADTPMTYNPETGSLSITLDLTDGNFKFRANTSWDYNYGKTDTEGVALAGGGDIPITAGNYTITLDLSQKKKPVYTYTVKKN